MLKDFKNEVKKNKGAILLACFTGNFGEGIDFKDELCRAIILVGVPYPPPSGNLILKDIYFQSKTHT